MRLSVDGKLKEFVVLRVTAGANDVYDRDPFCDAIKQAQEFSTLLDSRIGVELLAGENICQLDDGVIGGKQLGLGDRLRTACPGTDPGRSSLLISAFVSTTTRSLAFIGKDFS